MNFIRSLIAVSALPVRLAALGVLSAGVAGGATLLLAGSPASAPSLSLQTAQHATVAQATPDPQQPPAAAKRSPAPRPQPVPATTQRPVAASQPGSDDSYEGPDD